MFILNHLFKLSNLSLQEKMMINFVLTGNKGEHLYLDKLYKIFEKSYMIHTF